MRKIAVTMANRSKADIISILIGYILSLLCIILGISLCYQRLGTPSKEEINYNIRTGTHVVIDLRNGRVSERERSETETLKGVASPSPQADHTTASASDTPKKHDNLPTAVEAPPSRSHIVADKPVKERLYQNKPRYAKAAQEINFKDKGKPVLAVIIKGIGLNSTSTDAAIATSPVVTIGFSPYSTSIGTDVVNAVKKGHDILLHLPMEAGNLERHDPGPYSLLSGLSIDENLRRISIISSLTVRYAGVYTSKQENFSMLNRKFSPIMRELIKRDIPMVYGAGTSRLSFFQNTTQAGYPVIGADIHIDSAFDVSSTDTYIDTVLDRAESQGYAVVMISPYPFTIGLIERLLDQADTKDIIAKPISYFFNKLYADDSVSP